MKYAVIESGGKQYRVSEGDVIQVDRLQEEIGKEVFFDQVLLVKNDDNTLVGMPVIKGAVVNATIVDHIKGKKVIIFKYRPKQRYRVKTGHRQNYTAVKIDTINLE
jgi:large subunit ribosomal protein L21